jgi:hypothetical protein
VHSCGHSIHMFMCDTEAVQKFRPNITCHNDKPDLHCARLPPAHCVSIHIRHATHAHCVTPASQNRATHGLKIESRKCRSCSQEAFLGLLQGHAAWTKALTPAACTPRTMQLERHCCAVHTDNYVLQTCDRNPYQITAGIPQMGPPCGHSCPETPDHRAHTHTVWLVLCDAADWHPHRPLQCAELPQATYRC